MHIGQPLTWRARWLEHGWPSGARVSRHPTAGSHHSYRTDSATRRFRANCIVEVFFNDCQASNQCAQRGDRDDLEVRDGKNIWKVPPRWSALYSAWHWHSSWEPRLVLSLLEQKNQTIKRSGAESNNQNPTNTTIPSHWFSESKQSEIPGNPGKWIQH